MIDWQEDEREHPNDREARKLLQRRGIAEGPDGYTTQQLAGELLRRGWQVDFDVEKAEAAKAYAPSATVTQKIAAYGGDQVAILITILADAIRIDERLDHSPSYPFRADISVHDREGSPIALVEVKNRQGLNAEVATNVRRNLVAHGLMSQRVPFFLVVSQDVGFVWMQRPQNLPDDPPTVEFPMRPVVSHYVQWLVANERLGGSALEFVVATWLADLSIGREPDVPETNNPLTEIGFFEAIRGATVRIDERE